MDAFILWFQFCCPIPAGPLATLARMRAKQLSKASTALVIWLCACVRKVPFEFFLYWSLDTRHEAQSHATQ